MATPSDAPPSYEEAAKSSSTARPSQHNRLSANGIPSAHRRSMEDEARPLPEGWIRQFDPKERHQFFVDTRTERAIWHHPYDDEQYLASLDPEERARITGAARNLKVPTADYQGDSGDEGDYKIPPSPISSHPEYEAGPSSAAAADSKGKSSLGRRFKDKLTNSTHQEREMRRKQRAEEERKVYEMHQRVRAAMARAAETGEPQYIGKDSQGKDVYADVPQPYVRGGMYAPGAYRAGYPGAGAYGYNPYSNGRYDSPNVRYIRPAQPYGRPYGAGYGGGLGLPIVGGLAGGLLLGGLLGGF